MISKDLIEDSTMAYLHSYNTAMRETRNPNLAVQVAMGVVMSLMTVMKPPEPKQINPLEMIVAAMAQQQREAEKTEEVAEHEETGQADETV